MKVRVISRDRILGKKSRTALPLTERLVQINLPVAEVQCERGHQWESLPTSKMADNVEIDQ